MFGISKEIRDNYFLFIFYFLSFFFLHYTKYVYILIYSTYSVRRNEKNVLNDIFFQFVYFQNWIKFVFSWKPKKCKVFVKMFFYDAVRLNSEFPYETVYYSCLIYFKQQMYVDLSELLIHLYFFHKIFSISVSEISD